MPLTLYVTDLQIDCDIHLSVKKKPECSASDDEDMTGRALSHRKSVEDGFTSEVSPYQEMTGRSLPRSRAMKDDESPGGLSISEMSAYQGIVFKNAGPLAQKYLANKADFKYGIHYEIQSGDYRVGESPVALEGDDLVINYKGKMKRFKGTEGLWRLLTQDMNYFNEEDYFSQEDWETYMKILLITNNELAVRSPDEIPKVALMSARGEVVKVNTFCREARYVKEIDELLRRLVDLRKVELGAKMYCGYTMSCLLFWITQRLIGTVAALGKRMDKLVEWIKLNKKLIEESELLDLIVEKLPFGFHHKRNPICKIESAGESINKKNPKGLKFDLPNCQAHDKRYRHYLKGDKDLERDSHYGMKNLEAILIDDPFHFEKYKISDKITGVKLNAALTKGLYFMLSYYS